MRFCPRIDFTRALALLVSLSLARASAQDRALDALEPAPDQFGFTSFASTRTPGHLGTDATLWLDYGARLHAPDDKRFVRHRLGGTAVAQLGVGALGAVAVRMPFVLVQRGEEGAGLASAAAGNPALDGRVRVLGAKVRPDGSTNDGSALALRGVVHLPVGTSNALLADDRVRMELSAITDIELFGMGAGLAFAYRYRSPEDAPRSPALRGYADHALRLSGGFRLPLPLLSRAWPGKLQEAALLELDVTTPARDLFAKRLTPVEGRLGYRVVASDFFSTVTLGTGFTDAAGTLDLRAVLAVGWSPRQHDQDADGVPDRSDQCPHLPEDRDGFEDEDGCPDDDNDGDLILDEDDRCPNEPAEFGRDDDEDGCTDA